MLLLPALALLLAGSLGLFQLGLDRIALEVRAFELARSNAIGLELQTRFDEKVFVVSEGRFECVKLEKSGLIVISARSCMIPYGG